jgi:hypothetical protein
MVGEAFAVVGAFKSMMDIAKGLKDISDATKRNAVAIELQEKILSAQAAQSDLVERVRELENELARTAAAPHSPIDRGTTSAAISRPGHPERS